jgi:hypothetical protein
MPKGEFSQQQNQKKPVPVKIEGEKSEIEYFRPAKGRTKGFTLVPENEMLTLDIDKMIELFRKYQGIKEKLKAEGDIVLIRDKEFSTRSFIMKLQRFFGISKEVIRVIKEENKRTGEIVYKVWVKCILPSGRFVVCGGAASSTERNFSHLEHDLYSLAEVRATKRACEELLGFGKMPPLVEEEAE